MGNGTDDSRIIKISPSGSESTYATGLNDLQQIAMDAQGNIYCADFYGSEVDKVAAGGVVSTYLTNLTHPDGFAFDTAGNLYVAEYSLGTVLKVDLSKNVTTFASGMGLAEDLVAVPEPVSVTSVGCLITMLALRRRRARVCVSN